MPLFRIGSTLLATGGLTPGTGGKSRPRSRRQLIDPALNHPSKTIGGKLLEDVPNSPFAGGNPFAVRRFVHGFKSRFQRLPEPLRQFAL
jgi:hypothetical protein